MAGIKSSVEVVRGRIRTITEWILDDLSTTDMVNSAMALWQPLSRRQAQRYIAYARQQFKEKDEQSVEQKKAYYLARKRKLIREMNPAEKKTAAGVAAINKVLNDMAELEGVAGARKIEVTGKDGKDLVPPSRFDHLTTEQIEKLLENSAG